MTARVDTTEDVTPREEKALRQYMAAEKVTFKWLTRRALAELAQRLIAESKG
jgi:hypothetical protein